MSYLQQFIRSSDDIVQFDAEFDEANLAGTSVHSLEVHRDEMKSIWAGVKRVYEKCIFELNKKHDESGEEGEDADDDNMDEETIAAKYHTAYTTYVRFISRLNARIHASSASANVPQVSPDYVLGPMPLYNMNLPPCDTDIFKGDYQSWPSFRDLFTALFINNPRLCNIQKLFYLNKNTSGEARDIVQKCPPTEAGFELAWKNLRERFENKRLLINSQYRILSTLPKIYSESCDELKNLVRTIESCVSTLQLYKQHMEALDDIIIFHCTNSLPPITLALWEQSINRNQEQTWSQMCVFLTNRFQTLETVSEVREYRQINTPRQDNKSQNKRLNTNHANLISNCSTQDQSNLLSAINSSPQCRFCPNSNHPIRLCPKFSQMDVNERISYVKESGLCLNCFAKQHMVKDCKSKFNCQICQKRHHTLLHYNEDYSAPTSHSTRNLNNNIVPPTLGNIQSNFASNCNYVLLATAMVQVLHKGVQYPVRAFIDPGSNASFISERLFRRISPLYTSVNGQASGLNNSILGQTQKLTSIVIGSNGYHDKQVTVNAFVFKELVGQLPSCYVDPKIISKIPNMTLADPYFHQPSEIDVLIGEDVLDQFELDGFRRNICGRLKAKETIFGWVLSGNLETESTSPSHYLTFSANMSLEKQLTRFWEVEDIPQKPIISHVDRFCEELYSKTTRRNVDGRYIVSLPFKKSFTDGTDRLGNSRKIAFSQYLRNETRLSKNQDQKSIYDSVVKEYIDLGHMVAVPLPTDIHVSGNFYLPHHAVIKPESATTKVRVVFNASCKSSNGLSLNDMLHTGPILQSDLMLLLLKWRLHRYVFNSDIEKMYRQILVNSAETPYQRILFRNSVDTEIQDYELKTVTFGVNCAPYLAIRTLIQLASDVETIYPIASDILKNCMYVDDALYGAPDIPTAILARDQLIAALGSAGFNLRKWTANSTKILESIPTNHLLQEDFCEFEDSSNAKTLGVRWNAKSDLFFFSTKALSNRKNITKRQVLSEISKLFDPAGWLSPFIILSKILMRKIWESKSDWDECLPNECLREWNLFIHYYQEIDSIKIPRWLSFVPGCKVEIHAFCDASEKAYAAALYVKIITTQSISVNLLTAKSKVAPVKSITLPRLELCGAVLLSNLVESVLPSLNIPVYSLYKWCDSTIVLSWLQRSPSHWKTFVANRVSKILQTVGCDNWLHVPSQDNPADIGTRGSYPKDLSNNDLWWHGPTWLKTPSSNWPKLQQVILDTEEEQRPLQVNFSYFSNFDNVLERFSKYSTAIRTLCYVFRFLHKTHRKYRTLFHYESTSISHDEATFVRNRLIQIAQQVEYPNEHRALANNENISKTSTILNLNPFLDNNKLLRVNGRLSDSPSLSYDEKFPVILPYNCQLSKLLVQFSHTLSLHGGNQLVLRLVRMQFWIPKLKNLIKTTIHNCKECVLHKAKTQTQLMSALPPERTELHRAFYNTGLDFAGPFDLKNIAGRGCKITKGYVCIFVCFATKAIHLEATTDLSTAAFMAAFHRFTSRRGYPLRLYSDNGKTFVGASKQIARDFLASSRAEVMANFVHQHLQWHFIPPGSPHMGGLWEAGVKSFKAHFHKTAGSFKYTYEEFSTLLSKIESCLNSRPISPMSEDPMDLNALTPGHFLIGSPILAPPDPKIDYQPISLINRWQRLKAVQQRFCQRWKNEYLSELHKRTKWKTLSDNIVVGTMVVIKDDNVSVNEWRLGRVSKVYSGSDDRVRVADIITQRGLIKRPIVKLIILPV